MPKPNSPAMILLTNSAYSPYDGTGVKSKPIFLDTRLGNFPAQTGVEGIETWVRKPVKIDLRPCG